MKYQKEKILIVDDEPNFLRALRDTLELESFEIFTSLSALEALPILHENRIDAVITDLRMPKMSGIELLREIKQKWPGVIVFILTGYGSIQHAVDCMKLGAENYILKPINIMDLISNLKTALMKSSETEKKNAGNTADMDFPFIGQSSATIETRELVKKIAHSELSVVIKGESGTGKELIANAIYQYSNRKNKPFLKINCAALPLHLLESELFGYEPGAFTDAKKLKRGKLEIAHQGTLFLDEIGDMPIEMQAKLLRVLEEHVVERLGGNQLIQTDFRLISATNQNLELCIKNGEFRNDLYFRLNTMQINLKPLREIREDIQLISNYFVQRYSIEQKINQPSIHSKTMEIFLSYHWPGNVREMRNVIQRSVVLCDGKDILPEHLPDHMHWHEYNDVEIDSTSLLSLEDMEREHIQKVMQIASGNKNRTAALLKIHRDTLYRKLRKYELD